VAGFWSFIFASIARTLMNGAAPPHRFHKAIIRAVPIEQRTGKLSCALSNLSLGRGAIKVRCI
jgi:hypothetical protein